MSLAANLHLSWAFSAAGDKLPYMRVAAYLNLLHHSALDHLVVEYHADSSRNFTRTCYIVGNVNRCRARRSILPCINGHLPP